MKPRSFAALAIVTVVALVVAIATYATQNRWSQAKVTGDALFPNLAANASRVARIEIRQGDKAVTLARDKDSWSVADRSGYPAKTEAVRALLVKLAGAELVEAKTQKQGRYALLELEDPSGKEAKSRLLRLADDKGGVIAEAVIGKKRYDAFGANRSGTYVRRPGEAQTWLSNADLDVGVSPRDWVQPGILDIAASKIKKLTLEIPGEEPLVIERDAADINKHTLVGIPDGKKFKSGASVDSIVRAAGNIDLEDVRKLEGAPGTDAGVARLEGDGGLAVTLKLRKDGEASWVSIEATGGEGDAKKTADEVAKKAQGWEFKVAPHKADSILKRRADLFEAS
jgi:hypothetical protein